MGNLWSLSDHMKVGPKDLEQFCYTQTRASSENEWLVTN